MLTAEERALLPQVIAIWEKRLAKPVELTEMDRVNAQIAICEAQRLIDAAKEVNAQAADRMGER